MKKKSIRSSYSHGKVDVFTIKDDNTVISAMRAINEANRKTIFIVDAELTLKAVCTDGDIRRWILSGGSLDSPVMSAANTHPMFVHQRNLNGGVEKIMHEGISAIPVVDENNKVIDILIEAYDKKITEKISIPVVMMAGGQGTRLYPYTKILPKPLIPIGDLPISELIINRFFEYGCRDFYFILNYKRNMIKAYFD
ncbi:MAG: nucleotidyltransferase, partial [Lachnospiraceae bacterium]|nr:nucleotidyltransferase [Lachnospiraceae bacterium]